MTNRGWAILVLGLAIAGCDGNINDDNPLAVVTTRVSIDANRLQGNAGSQAASITPDGRYVVFKSSATNLVPGDNNNFADVFRKDVLTGEVIRVSVGTGPGNAEANGASCQFGRPVISANGQFVAFESLATNLLAGADLNGTKNDIYLRDIVNQTTIMVSVNNAGIQPSGPDAGDSSLPSISADGRFVAFMSLARNLTAEDTDNSPDVFVRDTQGPGATYTCSLPVGYPGNPKTAQFASVPSISADGRYVSFETYAALDPVNDPDSNNDIYVRDIVGLTTTLVSGNASPDVGPGILPPDSFNASISADGNWIVFESSVVNLVPGDTNGAGDIFLVNRSGGPIRRVSLSSAGTQGNGPSSHPSISGDGRWIVFDSDAKNLVTGDGNKSTDVFIVDTANQTTERLSVRTFGEEGDDISVSPQITPDGKFVVFESPSLNLVDDDTNGVRDIFLRGPLH